MRQRWPRPEGAAITYWFVDGSVFFQPETEFDGDLPVGDLALCQVAADFLHLEPVKVAEGLGRLGDAIPDGVVHALG
jgi:hypothetical protein